MSENIQADTQETDHAMLVVWGQFAHCLGIPQAFAEVPICQKTVIHTPQNKVIWAMNDFGKVQTKSAYSGVIHFGARDVTADLPGWFHDYNARQAIEAANK